MCPPSLYLPLSCRTINTPAHFATFCPNAAIIRIYSFRPRYFCCKVTHEHSRYAETFLTDRHFTACSLLMFWLLLGCVLAGADLGVTRVTSHPPPWRGSLFHVIIMRVTEVISMSFCAPPRAKSFSCKPSPLNARSLRSLGFSKSPPLKNPRSANV